MRHPRELDAERIRLALGSFDDERRPVLALVTDVAARLLKAEAERDALLSTNRTLTDQVVALQDRLEMRGENGEVLDDSCDGIAFRDETIRLLDRNAEQLCARIDAANEGNEQLRERVASLAQERDALRRFAGECLEPWPECLCDLEGDMQGRLHRAGLIEERIATEPGDDYDIGDSVFFLTDAGKSARAAVAQLREGEGK